MKTSTASLLALALYAASTSTVLASTNPPTDATSAPAKVASTDSAARQPANRQGGNILTMAVAWKQTAAEYRALYHQGFNLARMQVEAALKNRKPGDKPLAVITDVDDTVLSPVDYWGHLIEHGIDFFDDSVWDRWVPENRFLPTAGALDFLNFCQENDVAVFYVTSRDQGENTYQYVEANLRAAGFPYADREHLVVLRDTSNKEVEQLKIAEKYEVVTFLGDNLNDFKRAYYVKDVDERTRLMEADRALYGTKFVIFPNPTDGHWVRAICEVA